MTAAGEEEDDGDGLDLDDLDRPEDSLAQRLQPVPRLTCLGSPQLEIHSEVTPEFMRRYELKPNIDVKIEEPHWRMLGELVETASSTDSGLEYAVGGSAGSTARAVRALHRANERGLMHGERDETLEVMLLGSVGKDEMSKRLQEICALDGLGVLFSETDEVLTGWRAVLRTSEPQGANGLGPPPGADPLDHDVAVQVPRHVASATSHGAGREYKLDHLRFKVWQHIEATSIVYVDAHFLTVSSESVRIVAEHCAKTGKLFCLNLSAQYLCSFFRELILQVVPYTDYIFGNEMEYLGLLGDKAGRGCELDDALDWLVKIPRADGNETKRRRVVATNGSKPCVVASTWKGYGVMVQRFPVPPLRTGRFVTGNGAGDAFAGGFLYGLMREADLESCVELALFAAHSAVQRGRQRFQFKDRPTVKPAVAKAKAPA